METVVRICLAPTARLHDQLGTSPGDASRNESDTSSAESVIHPKASFAYRLTTTPVAGS